ncbi:MarR family winged helix-turn-helix transcriptional regulator [Stackebrandtia nassauensis]|uniref:Transcriptional regulator, MarR family n=1 Tax=Stackebrandtia nassauensis (strain DSM 44728 / CIP 108903 / NRRL B-16338 / NBRC 102104 / LLR-40K-21) TaxID=446470 RepID=D3Q0N3_STANL|nr:MarR family transcriptional regulator [Stackebrandtia nassauensis]ADD41769.1 transcriptional regulator, MarR family [Stackebrandtia nassauensis DSM 44728]
MSEPSESPQLEQRMGYVLKQVQAALHGAMDERLRGHGLSVAQYACLELLAETPGLSNAELARGAFVTRQAMNTVLRGLLAAGHVDRPAEAEYGRARPARLTDAGEALLAAARADVVAIEERMVTGLPRRRRRELLAELAAMARNLSGDSG